MVLNIAEIAAADLKRWRIEAGLTQEQVSARMGGKPTRSLLARMEKGGKGVEFSTYLRVLIAGLRFSDEAARQAMRIWIESATKKQLSDFSVSKTNSPEIDGIKFNALGQSLLDGTMAFTIDLARKIGMPRSKPQPHPVIKASWGDFVSVEKADLFDMFLLNVKLVWDWAAQNDPFKPNWLDFSQEKRYIYFSSDDGKWRTKGVCTAIEQFLLPYFSSVDSAIQCIEDCKSSLEIIRNFQNS